MAALVSSITQLLLGAPAGMRAGCPPWLGSTARTWLWCYGFFSCPQPSPLLLAAPGGLLVQLIPPDAVASPFLRCLLLAAPSLALLAEEGAQPDPG